MPGGHDLAVGLDGNGVSLIIVRCGYHTACSKGRVKGTVCIVTDKGKIIGAIDPCCHNLTVRLDGNGLSITIRSDGCGNRAACSKGRVKGSVCIVTDKGKFIVSAAIIGSWACSPCGHNLAIGLDGNGIGIIIVSSLPDSCDYYAACAKGRIKGSVRIETRKGKIILVVINLLVGVVCIPCHHNLAVRLDGNGRGSGIIKIRRISTRVCGHPAASAKGRIKGSIRIVARKSKISNASSPCGHDLAVGLDGNTIGVITIAPSPGCDRSPDIREVCGYLAASAKGRIKGSVRVVARKSKIPVSAPCSPCGNNLAVGLDGNGIGFIIVRSEVCSYPATGAKGRVNAPISGPGWHSRQKQYR